MLIPTILCIFKSRMACLILFWLFLLIPGRKPVMNFPRLVFTLRGLKVNPKKSNV